MTLPQASGHLGNDPRAPRAKDLARAVPVPGADLATLDDAKIFAAPDDPREWDDWRQQLRRWRDDARARIGYRGERYEREDVAWTQRCFSVCLAWLWDERLYDRTRQVFTVPPRPQFAGAPLPHADFGRNGAASAPSAVASVTAALVFITLNT